MSSKTLIDISNSIFAITNPSILDISNIFHPTEGVDFTNDSISEITTLIKTLYSNSNYSHLALYTAYHLYLNSSVSSTKKLAIIDYLYGENIYDVENNTIENSTYLYNVYYILTDDSTRVSSILNNHGSDVSDVEKEIYQKTKKIYYEKFTADICNNTLLAHFKDHSNSDDDDYWTTYLHTINKNLNLSGINLSNKTLTNHNFEGYKLQDADLSGTNFSNSDLSGANISRSNVHNLNLNNATLTRIIANDISGVPINIPNGFEFDSERDIISKSRTIKTLAQWKSNANNLGITNSVIDDIDTDTDIYNNGNIRSTTQNKIENAISGTDLQKKKKRHGLFNYLFKKNASVSKLKMLSSKLSLPEKFKKTYTVIYKHGTTIDYIGDPDINESTGFYIALEDGDFVKFKLSFGESTFSITRIGTLGDSGKYIISGLNSTENVNITNVISSTYADSGYFMDDDVATINQISLFFGGVGESETPDPSSNQTDVFFPVYFDASGSIVDNSANAIETFDASYNLILNANYCSSNTLKNLIKYKIDSSGNYTFLYDSSKKTLFETQMKLDLSGSLMSLHGGTFVSTNYTYNANFGTMFLQYMADAFFGHPLGQTAITNDTAIINEIGNSDIYLQFSYALTNGLNTSTFTSHEICKKIILQLKDKASERFIGEQVDVSYNMPWLPGDNISIYVNMNSDISLDSIASPNSNTDVFEILKTVFHNNNEIVINETNRTVKLKVKTWRIKFNLL